MSTPKLPKRVPRVMTAEEMNGFLDNILGAIPALKRTVFAQPALCKMMRRWW